MATSDKQPPVTNGEFCKDGQWYMWCGPTAVPIRKQDASGQPMPPPTPEKVVSSS